MKTRKRLLATLLTAVIASSFIAGCASGTGAGAGGSQANAGGNTEETAEAAVEEEAGETTTKDTFTWSSVIGIGDLNFAKSGGIPTSAMDSYVASFLVDRYFKEDGSFDIGVCERGLATDYKYDDDNMGITFNLREGVKFHNGTEFTAKDAAFSIKLFSVRTGFEFIDYDNIKTDGDYTIYVPFTKLDGSALIKISVIPMWSADHWDEVGDETAFFTSEAIGTGPFKISEWVADDHVNTDRFDDYFGHKAIISHCNYRFIPENTVALAELQSGGIDYIYRADGNVVSDIEAGVYGDNIEVDKGLDEASLTIQFNSSADMFDSLELRQAVCYGTDRDAIQVGAFGEAAQKTWTVMSDRGQNLTQFPDDKWFYPYDVDLAKGKLEEAGYKDTDGDGYVESADGTPLKMRLITIGTQATQATTAEIFKNNMAQIGIDIEIIPYDLATWAQTTRNAPDDWELYFLNQGGITSDSGREYNLHDMISTHLDASANYDDYYNNWILPLSETIDSEEWMAKVRELEPLLMEKYLWWYPLVQNIDLAFRASNCKGFKRISYTTWMMEYIYFD